MSEGQFLLDFVKARNTVLSALGVPESRWNAPPRQSGKHWMDFLPTEQEDCDDRCRNCNEDDDGD